MGLRFHKRINIFKGLSVNLSKSGLSWTLGRPGASVNVRNDKIAGSVGIPGSGLSYRKTLLNRGAAQTAGLKRYVPSVLFWLLLVVALGYWLLFQ